MLSDTSSSSTCVPNALSIWLRVRTGIGAGYAKHALNHQCINRTKNPAGFLSHEDNKKTSGRLKVNV